MSLAMRPSPLPLVGPAMMRPTFDVDSARIAAAHRLALIGHAKVHFPPLTQPTGHPTPTTSSSVPALNAKDVPAKTSNDIAAMSSVAKRKQRLASSSVPTYARAQSTQSTPGLSPSPSDSTNDSGSSGKSFLNSLQLAPVGVVDMRFLSRQPPPSQHKATMSGTAAKTSSKPSSVSTPTSPSAPLAIASAPKNQRSSAKSSNARPFAAAAPAATNPKASRPNHNTATSVIDNSTSSVMKKSKHAFLFRPNHEQPSSGPYIRFSPMYHYYHPYRNMHREAIKTEWLRLHPVVEAAPPAEEEEHHTPPRRTSGRQKKLASGKASGKGKGDKGKKGAASSSQPNEATGGSPPPVNGRRPRGPAKGSKAAAKTGGKGKGNTAASRATSNNKRKRAEFEDEEKQPVVALEEAAPTPPSKRPRRGAAAAAAALSLAAAAQEADEGSKEEGEGLENGETQEDGEPKQIKRRMRPNARKTAAARAAAMEAKKKRTTDDGDVTPNGEGLDDDEGGDSLKDNESNANPTNDESQKGGSPLQIEIDLHQEPNGIEIVNGEDHPEQEAQESIEDAKEEKRPKGVRGGRGGAGRGGLRGKGKRQGTPLRGVGRRGGARATPRLTQTDDDGSTLALPVFESDIASAQISAMGTPAEELPAFSLVKPKPKRMSSTKKVPKQLNGVVDEIPPEEPISSVPDPVVESLPTSSSLPELTAQPWSYGANVVGNGVAKSQPPEAVEYEMPTKLE